MLVAVVVSWLTHLATFKVANHRLEVAILTLTHKEVANIMPLMVSLMLNHSNLLGKAMWMHTWLLSRINLSQSLLLLLLVFSNSTQEESWAAPLVELPLITLWTLLVMVQIAQAHLSGSSETHGAQIGVNQDTWEFCVQQAMELVFVPS